MSKYTARQVHLISRPVGMPTSEDFKLVDVELEPPQDGQVLVNNIYLSVDPYMRGRMRAEGTYAKPYALNEVMYGGAIGEVIESNDSSLQAGDTVLNQAAWQDKFVANAKNMSKITPFDAEKLSLYLGTLGMPGMTAYLGLLKFGEPKEGETVFVSAASGAVGANVCQIAKLKGCRVIGSVGSDEKARWLLDEVGVDGVINYKTCGNLTEALAQAAPDGIDVYFENVGGDVSRAVAPLLNAGSRVPICGYISQYNAKDIASAESPFEVFGALPNPPEHRFFLVFEWDAEHAETTQKLADWLRSGELKYRESVADGIDAAIGAFRGMLRGENFGKQLVKIADA